jgi:alpha-beta hydrolase superfamily lysophospholipase
MKVPLHKEVSIQVGNVVLGGELYLPDTAKSIVVFSHGSGSSRFSTRNRAVATYLQKRNFGTLLFDLLTAGEDKVYENRFDIDLLTERLAGVTKWLMHHAEASGYQIGYFGASTGAASALKAAAVLKGIGAIVSRGGRPDLAGDDLYLVTAPTLLIVGGLDDTVIDLNREAFEKLSCEKELKIVEGATHLFEEPGRMEIVCEFAAEWFEKYLRTASG